MKSVAVIKNPAFVDGRKVPTWYPCRISEHVHGNKYRVRWFEHLDVDFHARYGIETLDEVHYGVDAKWFIVTA